jgi:multiple sugar transport system permease protein
VNSGAAAALTQGQSAARHKPARRIRWGRHIEGYLIISPWLIGFLLFIAGPMLASLVLSFTTFDVLSDPRWVGLQNYQRLTTDDVVQVTLANTAIFTLMVVPAQIVVSLGLALLLNLPLRGIGLFRTFYYLPSVVPAIASALVWILVLNPDFGLVNGFLRSIHLPGPPWLTDPDSAKPTLAMMSLWYVGAQMLVFLAALQGVRQELYDSASIDGANVFQRFFNVTLPMITPALFFNLVTGVIHATQVFTLAFVATAGGPSNSTRFVVMYIYEQAFQSLRMGYASALAWLLCFIILVLTLMQFRASRWVYYEGEVR